MCKLLQKISVNTFLETKISCQQRSCLMIGLRRTRDSLCQTIAKTSANIQRGRCPASRQDNSWQPAFSCLLLCQITIRCWLAIVFGSNCADWIEKQHALKNGCGCVHRDVAVTIIIYPQKLPDIGIVWWYADYNLQMTQFSHYLSPLFWQFNVS